MKRKNYINAVLRIMLLAFCSVISVYPQTTEFSYQGFITDNSASANGNFDFEFRLYDAATGGISVGSAQRFNVPVTNGVFSVVLDFGNFPAANRFLEIGVRPAGGVGFTTLAPRSKVLAVPSATTANNAVQLNGTPASQFVQTIDPRLSDARNPLSGSTNYVQNRTTTQAATNFNIGGNGTVGGTLTGNVVSAGSQYNIGSDRILSNSGTGNIFAGKDAGAANTGGVLNSFFGSGAGQVNTTGGGNSFFGTVAGASNLTGVNNSFFGVGAGSENASGNNNSFFGVNAGVNNTVSGNSFFGAFAGSVNTTGNNNAFFGFEAGKSVTIGGRNSVFGYQAGRTVTSGSRNSFFGAEAGFSASGSSQDNSFFGDKAGRLNSSGGRNSFFGAGAGENTTTGSDNVFIGQNAGVNNSAGSNNTFVGGGAGFSGLSSGSNNTAIGAGAMVSPNVSFSTAIGAGVIASSSSSVFIGRDEDLIKIFGTFWALGDVNMANNSGERVKIGEIVPDPAQKLDVEGNIRIGNPGGFVGCVEDRDGTVIAGTCSSDLRFKKNITSFGNVLSNFSRLRPVNYFWRADEFSDQHFGTKQSFGLIAQEVEAAFPELVSTDDKGYKAVNYSKLPLLTIQAVNELKAENDALKQKLQRQQTEIDELKKAFGAIRENILKPKPSAKIKSVRRSRTKN